jgi:hypothetical protein
MKTTIPLLLLLSLLLTQAATPADDCIDSTPIDWTIDETVTALWGRSYTFEDEYYSPDNYTIEARDFAGVKSALIKVKKRDDSTGEEILRIGESLNFSNLRLELADITVDSRDVPSAKLNLYLINKMELNINVTSDIGDFSDDIDMGNLTFDESSHNSEWEEAVIESGYAPGEEKTVEIELVNRGGAWIDDVEIDIDVGGLILKDRSGFDFRGDLTHEKFGCMGVDDAASIDFTVTAPRWDGETPIEEVNYSISICVRGTNINDESIERYYHINLSCIDPLLVLRQYMGGVHSDINKSDDFDGLSRDDEINMAEWTMAVLDVRTLYRLNNITIECPELPEHFKVIEIVEEGSNRSISVDDPYHIRYKLIPLRPGNYTIKGVKATAHLFDKEFSWDADDLTIKVHGPNLTLTKKVTAKDGETEITLRVHNDGDRCTRINISDIIPGGADYVENSAEKSVEWGDLTVNIPCIFLSGVLYAGNSAELSYRITADEKIHISPAMVEFRSRCYHKGAIFSNGTMIIEGAEYEDPVHETVSENAASATPTPELKPTPKPTSTRQLRTDPAELSNSRSDGNQTHQTALYPYQPSSDINRLPRQIRAGMEWFAPAVETVGKVVSTIARDVSMIVNVRCER